MTTIMHVLTSEETFNIDVATRVLQIEREPELAYLVADGLLTPDEALRILDQEQWWQVCTEVPAMEVVR